MTYDLESEKQFSIKLQEEKIEELSFIGKKKNPVLLLRAFHVQELRDAKI